MRFILILISILLIENQRVNGCNSGSSSSNFGYNDGLCFGGIEGCVDVGCNREGINIIFFFNLNSNNRKNIALILKSLND
jgi:hypothetical protein